MIGGTVALAGQLIVEADPGRCRDTQLAQLVRLVEEAQADKAGRPAVADRIWAVFVPAVLACSGAARWAGSRAGGPPGAVSDALAV